MKPIFTAACPILSSVGAPGAIAQEHEHAYDAAALGTVNFPVWCNAEAQRRFNMAASLLYSFHWEKVDVAVAAALEADAGCAMAYWAKAIESLNDPLGAPPTPKLEQQG